jgi:hypothetical protein
VPLSFIATKFVEVAAQLDGAIPGKKGIWSFFVHKKGFEIETLAQFSTTELHVSSLLL